MSGFTEKINPFVSTRNPFVTNGLSVVVNAAVFTRNGNPFVNTSNPFVSTGLAETTIGLVVTKTRTNLVIFGNLTQKCGRISYNKTVIVWLLLMDALTGAAIAKIAFDEFVKSGAGEVAKKAVGGAIEQLRSMIKSRFKGKNAKAEEAIAKIETEGSPEALNELSVCLDDEMNDQTFAHTLQQLAEQITNIQNSAERQYINHGRDQINVENITGNPKFGGS